VKYKLTIDRSRVVEIAVVVGALAGLLVLWQLAGLVPLAVYYGYIVVSVAIGLTLYFGLNEFDQPLRRRLVMVLLGTSLFGAAALRDPVAALFQIEGLFFDLLNGVFWAAVIHYLLAKLIGPLLFGRVWCGWGCWTAMVLDQLPFKRSHGRLDPRWGTLRYIHFGLSATLVAVLWSGFAYRPGTFGTSALMWFLGGNALYYLAGVTLAFALRDNRAFCKYLCPITVPLKLSSRFSVLKVRGDPQRCCEKRVCEKACPMDIPIAEYIKLGQRVLSTECIMCQACISVCPEDALSLSLKWDGQSWKLPHQPER
jgi:ferredoxin-type protein NapH